MEYLTAPTFWEFARLPLFIVVLVIILFVTLSLLIRGLFISLVERLNDKKAGKERMSAPRGQKNQAYSDLLNRYDKKHAEFREYARNGVQDVVREKAD